jgi:L-lactate utilization protein LutC
MSREAILERVRSALDRHPGTPAAQPPEVRIRVTEADRSTRITHFVAALEKLAGKAYLAPTADAARAYVDGLISGQKAIASNSVVLSQYGIPSVPGVVTGIHDRREYRDLCSEAAFGITSADYALADTGTLVMLSSAEEARMISLLPPVHVAILPAERILSGLDELLSNIPKPAERTSAMVLITGPSRTADIEQILVRGVHGPGELHVVIV